LRPTSTKRPAPLEIMPGRYLELQDTAFNCKAPY
jgi:hypothetical protein